jgi:hypothetical protein
MEKRRKKEVESSNAFLEIPFRERNFKSTPFEMEKRRGKLYERSS